MADDVSAFLHAKRGNDPAQELLKGVARPHASSATAPEFGECHPDRVEVSVERRPEEQATAGTLKRLAALGPHVARQVILGHDGSERQPWHEQLFDVGGAQTAQSPITRATKSMASAVVTNVAVYKWPFGTVPMSRRPRNL